MAGGGKEASFDSAQFIFSQDAACTDTQRYKLHVVVFLLTADFFDNSYRKYLI